MIIYKTYKENFVSDNLNIVSKHIFYYLDAFSWSITNSYSWRSYLSACLLSFKFCPISFNSSFHSCCFVCFFLFLSVQSCSFSGLKCFTNCLSFIMCSSSSYSFCDHSINISWINFIVGILIINRVAVPLQFHGISTNDSSDE